MEQVSFKTTLAHRLVRGRLICVVCTVCGWQCVDYVFTVLVVIVGVVSHDSGTVFSYGSV